MDGLAYTDREYGAPDGASHSPGPITQHLNDTYWSWREDGEYAVRVDSEQRHAAHLAGLAKAVR